jgi:hydrogenase expression/formation protein HypE
MNTDRVRRIQLAHGGGGRAMNRLIEELLLPAFTNPALAARHDGAVLALHGPCAFTTDSYVVQPIEFPGGDIGTLAINGTCNDLAMCGARPEHLSVGLIIEEGLPWDTFARIVASLARTAAAAGVRIVTGDTKVVERGKADQLFINTSGIGRIVAPMPIEPRSVRPGDAVILSGDIGRHGMAVMAARNDLGFEPPLVSDCANLAPAVLALFEAGIEVHCLRDLTRGGLASALVEIAEAAASGIEIDEARVSVSAPVATACELLGLDALHVANEGRFVAFVPAHEARRAEQVLRAQPVAADAVQIGAVNAAGGSQVILCTAMGPRRPLDMLSGEQLPRIC